MGRSGQIRAKYDHLIREFLKDERYQVREDGTIWTCIPLNGRGTSSTWRRSGKYSGEGYIQVRYKGVYLQAHRVVYQKHVGTLQADLIVDHKNAVRDDNEPNNLRLATARSNRNYIEQRKEENNAEIEPTLPEEREANGSTGVLESSAQPDDSIEGMPF